MPIRLLDVNVLLPLLWTDHPRHADVRGWFLAHRSDGWATCPITQLGFVRISRVPNVLPSPATVATASAVLRRWTEAGDHHFWLDDLAVPDVLAGVVPPLTGHKQLTDACLIALARVHGGALSTFDRALYGRPCVEALA